VVKVIGLPLSVVVTTEADKVIVLTIRLVTVLAGRTEVKVDVTPGRVMELITVDTGN